ncbi:MAG: chitosanase [Parvularculaceae bacterium]
MNGRQSLDFGIDSFLAAKLRAIVSVFESGGPTPSYDMLAARADDAGGLSYGVHQASLTSGNLHKLIEQYVETPGAQFADQLAPYLGALEARDRALDRDKELHGLLKQAAGDPVMQETQDAFFDSQYMAPAVDAVLSMGFRTPMAFAVAYDSFIHGSWGKIRNRVNASAGAPSEVGEARWLRAYVDAREDWLKSLSSLANRTAYRPQSFRRLMDEGFWDLPLPFPVRDTIVESRHIPPSAREGYASRTFEPIGPRTSGGPAPADRKIQELLRAAGYEVAVDGQYGPKTAGAVKVFQLDRGLPDTGVVDGPTYEALTAAQDLAPSARAPAGPDSAGEFEPMPPAPRHSNAPVSTIGAGIAGAGAVAVGADALTKSDDSSAGSFFSVLEGREQELLIAVLVLLALILLVIRSRRI